MKKLSPDQRNLYDWAQMLLTGEYLKDLELRAVGKVSMARWLTFATSVFIVASSKEAKSLAIEHQEQLRKCVRYLLSCYVPCWFLIKQHDNFTMGPTHWLNHIKKVRELGAEYLELLKKSFQRNAYYFHSENLLVSLLSSKCMEDRIFAVRHIKAIRVRDGDAAIGNLKVRKRIIPAINWEAVHLRDIIDEKDYKSEPSITASIPTVQLEEFIDVPLKTPDYPCHSQCNEFAVKQISEAGNHVSSEASRDGFVLTRQVARHILKPKGCPKSKKDFIPLISASSVSYTDTIKRPSTPPPSTS